MNERLSNLIGYVTADGRVYPIRWGDFAKLVGLNRPGRLSPLILGGAIASDSEKRRRLVQQIEHISDDPILFDRAEEFLRSLPDSGWHKAAEPLSDLPNG